jgi:hypothetical protein
MSEVERLEAERVAVEAKLADLYHMLSQSDRDMSGISTAEDCIADAYDYAISAAKRELDDD